MKKGLLRKMLNKITDRKASDKISEHESKLEKAQMAYADELDRMKTDQGYYDGNRNCMGNPNGEKSAKKVAVNVRNITYELVESQVDTSIPSPKIKPIHEEDAELATKIENLLTDEIKRLHASLVNDVNERNVPILGGDFAHIEWDSTAGYHSTVGDVSISERSPRYVIPQPGITDIDRMDYIFIQTQNTKDYVKKRYGVDVSDAEQDIIDDTTPANEDLVTVNIEYYRNETGGIGIFVWCDDYILLDMEDYQARHTEKCAKCGRVKTEDVCPICGSKKFVNTSDDYEEIDDDIKIYSGEMLNSSEMSEEPQLDDSGKPVMDENGQPITIMVQKKTKIPYYTPNEFPIVLRKNVSRDGYLLGYSDVEVIKDQQDLVKKLGSKINEKLLKGGSYFVLPKEVHAETNGEEMNILRVDNPSAADVIKTVNAQPDVSKDINMLESNYQWAKSTLGITDSFQGKYDASATSGTAKQYSINQAAGRLESKRILKNEYWSRVYEMMFKFMLAYADQPIPVINEGTDGSLEFDQFNRYDFLRKDAAGELYWDDEFIFDVDPTSAIMSNREAMWNANDLKLQSGAFGQVGDLQTALLYWTLQEKHAYPNAGEIKKMIESRIIEEKQNAQQIGGVNNAVSSVPAGNENQGQQILG